MDNFLVNINYLYWYKPEEENSQGSLNKNTLKLALKQKY